MLVNRIEQRILVGTVAFLVTLVLVGWIAINEGGRMAAFDKQFLGRSIESGATLFAANCSTCHGTDARGSAKGPALNSPLLFGFDYMANIHREEQELLNERDLDSTTEARKAEIDARIAELEAEEQTQSVALQPAIDKGYDPDTFSRLQQVEWSGSLNNYIYSTIISGRPVSSAYWPDPMPNWAQISGGPLRTDQVQDLTNFILNFDKGADWTTDDLNAVVQFPKVPGDPAEIALLQDQVDQLQQSGGVLPEYVGVDTPLPDIMAKLAELTGDPQRGDVMYHGQDHTPPLPCFTCHTNASLAPLVEGTYTRIEDIRLNDPAVQAMGITTADEYIANSIIHPASYIVPNFADTMPQNFGTYLTYQDLADLIAFLKTQDQQ